MFSDTALEALYHKVAELLSENQRDNWLANQGWQGIAHYTQEEIYELIDAIAKADFAAVQDELADLLFHLLIYAQMGEYEQRFDIYSLANSALEKLQQRYDPKHNEQASHAHWQSQKLKKKWQQQGSVLADMPANLPALLQAKKLQALKKSLGLNEVINNAQLMDSSQGESASIKTSSIAQKQQHFGELLYRLVAQAEQHGVHAEQALRQVNQQQYQQLLQYESQLQLQGENPLTITPVERATLWNAIINDKKMDDSD